MKKLVFFVFIFLITSSIFAQIPLNYYQPAYNKSGSSLRTALQGIIDNHTVVSYGGLYDVYETSDNTADNKVWDMYSYCSWTHKNKTCGNYTKVCDCYNREHSVPQSWFNEKSPMVSDAFHVYPTDGRVNGQRSNFPFGECTGGTTLSNGKGRAGSSTFSGYSGSVFEPVDEYKGDFARTYFYMATRYAGSCENWNSAVFSTTNLGLSNYSVNLFMKWHRQDPVSPKEVTRNNAIYAHQDNRNPFIDHPDLAEYLWGTKKSVSWNPTTLDESPIFQYFVYPNPASDMLYVHVDTTKNVQYVLYSIDKKVLTSGVFDTNWSIDVSGMQSGMYVLQLYVEGISYSYKVLVNTN
jgi:endonuclease I